MKQDSILEQLDGIFSSFTELTVAAIDNLYNNKMQDGLKLALEVYEGISEVKTILAQMSFPGIEELDKIYVAISDAYENKDYVLVADLLEYELLNRLTNWRKQMLKG